MLCSLARGFTTWLYCAGSRAQELQEMIKFYSSIACENIRFSSLFVDGDVPRETSPQANSSSMIYKRKITMWKNFLSVWFFMQHERWAFIYIILFRAYSIFVHRNCGSVSKSIRLLFRLHCMVMLRYGWCEFWKFQNLVTDQWLI